MLNMYTTGHPTWENDDKDHLMDAYIPDPTGKSGGFWISPLGVSAEVTHDVIRYRHSKGNLVDAAGQIVQNKFSPLLRAEEVLRTGRDYTGAKILSEGERLKQAGKALLPIPLPASGLASDTPGQTQRQLYGSLGLKVEIAKKQASEQDRIAKEMFGKEFKNLSVGQRLKVDRATVKEPLSIQQRFNISQRATEKQFMKLQDVEDSLSPRVKDWLKEKGGKITEYQDFQRMKGYSAKLSEEEKGRLEELMKKEYNSVLEKLVGKTNINSTNVNRYISLNLEVARKRAWAEMRKEIRANSEGGAK
jgi:hypothetical protein